MAVEMVVMMGDPMAGRMAEWTNEELVEWWGRLMAVEKVVWMAAQLAG